MKNRNDRDYIARFIETEAKKAKLDLLEGDVISIREYKRLEKLLSRLGAKHRRELKKATLSVK